MRDATRAGALALGLLGSACGGFEVPAEEREGAAGAGAEATQPSQASCAAEDDSELAMTHPTGIHAVGSRLEDSAGNQVFLRGVNRSGSEYRCIQSGGFFDGPCDEASVRAMKTWGINAVRVPLNEGCWLDINGAPADYSGEDYQRAIQSYVFLLHKYDLIPILELHWSRSGEGMADGQDPLPNADHSLTFWSQVASAFKDDAGVIFEPFNEPFPDGNQDSTAGWECWRDGCMARGYDANAAPYAAVGMQDLVSTIRDAGATQLILLGGLQYSNALTRWREYRPLDPLDNLAAAWHVYNFNACADAACYEAAPLALASDFPLVASEIGQDDCEGDFISPLMSFLDQHGAGYLAWSWNVQGVCLAKTNETAGNPWPLIDHFETATPNSAYAEAFRDHVLEMTR